jgi:hypothetical protein
LRAPEHRSVARSFGRYAAQIAAELHKPDRRFVREAVYGMLERRNITLADIARSLDEKTRSGRKRSLLQKERRLSRRLGTNRVDDRTIETNYLKTVTPTLRRDGRPPTIAVDMTDIAKPGAKAMPCLAEVHDGSTGEITLGYNVMTVEAVGLDGRRMPLSHRLFSADAPGYVSQNRVMAESIGLVQPFVDPSSVWVFDSGFDGRRTYETFDRLARPLLFVVRAKAQQRVLFHDGHRLPALELARSLPEWRRFRVRAKSPKAKCAILEYAWLPKVEITGYSSSGWRSQRGRSMGLVVVRGTGKEPIVLLTNVPLQSEADALEVANAYMERWGAEDAHRFIKTAFSLENVRILNWVGLRRIILLAMLAYGFLSLLVHTKRRVIDKVARSFQAFGPVPVYLFYRLLEGIAAVIRSALRSGPRLRRMATGR